MQTRSRLEVIVTPDHVPDRPGPGLRMTSRPTPQVETLLMLRALLIVIGAGDWNFCGPTIPPSRFLGR